MQDDGAAILLTMAFWGCTAVECEPGRVSYVLLLGVVLAFLLVLAVIQKPRK